MQDQEEIERLFRTHRERMLLLAKMLLKDEEDSRDVVSEVFTDIIGSDLVLRPAEASAYLLACVRNKCLNLLNRHRVAERVRRLLPVDAPMADQLAVVDKIRLEQLWQYVDTALTPQTARVVRLRFKERKTYQEIADQLAISTTAVYKHLAQAVRTLRQCFNPEKYGET